MGLYNLATQQGGAPEIGAQLGGPAFGRALPVPVFQTETDAVANEPLEPLADGGCHHWIQYLHTNGYRDSRSRDSIPEIPAKSNSRAKRTQPFSLRYARVPTFL